MATNLPMPRRPTSWKTGKIDLIPCFFLFQLQTFYVTSSMKQTKLAFTQTWYLHCSSRGIYFLAQREAPLDTELIKDNI